MRVVRKTLRKNIIHTNHFRNENSEIEQPYRHKFGKKEITTSTLNWKFLISVIHTKLVMQDVIYV